MGSGEPAGGGIDVAAARYRRSGALDDSFGGGDGFKLTDLGGNTQVDYAEGLLVLGNDKFVVGAYFQGTTLDFAIARFLPNGGRDLNFGGGDGFTAVNFGGDEVATVLIAHQGDYYIAGDVGTHIGVARYHQNGNVDVGFGLSGLGSAELASAGAGDLSGHGDGVVLVGYEGALPPDWDFVAARFQT